MTSETRSQSSASAPPDATAAAPLVGRAAVIAVVVVLFASFADLLDATIVTVAAPAIAKDVNASATQLQWMLAAYVLALGSGLVTGGRVGDDYGHRRVFLASLAAFAVASAACALAVGPEMLIVTRVLQGLAGGLMVPQVFGIIRSSFDPAGMAKAFGAYGAVQGLAAVAGPLLGGFLVDADLFGLGWRTIFWVNLPIAAVALALGWRVLPKSARGQGNPLDLTGAGLSAVAVLMVLLRWCRAVTGAGRGGGSRSSPPGSPSWWGSGATSRPWPGAVGSRFSTRTCCAFEASVRGWSRR